MLDIGLRLLHIDSYNTAFKEAQLSLFLDGKTDVQRGKITWLGTQS